MEGYLVRIEEFLREGSQHSIDPDDDETPCFSIVIDWISPTEPFSDGGDSGSLVFATINGQTIPLGIHYFSKRFTSYAYLLWSWCTEIEMVFDIDIYLCGPDNCASNSENSDIIL